MDWREAFQPGVHLSHLAEKVEVGGHNDAGAEVHFLREGGLVGQMIGHKSDGDLSLTVGLLLDRCGDCSLLQMRRHLCEQVCRYQFYFAGQTAFRECPTDRQAVHGVDVNSCECWHTAK